MQRMLPALLEACLGRQHALVIGPDVGARQPEDDNRADTALACNRKDPLIRVQLRIIVKLDSEADEEVDREQLGAGDDASGASSGHFEERCLDHAPLERQVLKPRHLAV
eukprot:scaffold157851_cov33-Tisochrysis_lutea.AAC.2